MQTEQSKLTDHQLAVLDDVFQTKDADGFITALNDLYLGFLISSNDYQGELTMDEIRNKFFIVTQLSKLLKAVEPLGLKT